MTVHEMIENGNETMRLRRKWRDKFNQADVVLGCDLSSGDCCLFWIRSSAADFVTEYISQGDRSLNIFCADYVGNAKEGDLLLDLCKRYKGIDGCRNVETMTPATLAGEFGKWN